MDSTDLKSHSGDRLSLLYRLSQTFNSSLDLNEVLNLVIDEAILILHAERGFVMLLGADGSQVFSVARGPDRKTIDQPQFQLSQSVVQKVAVEGQPILTSDAQSDTRFNMRDSVLLLGLRSVLCVPLKMKEEVKGVIYLDNRFTVGIFTRADLELLSAIASIGAIAIENARLYQLAIEKGRMQRELQLAREMQEGFLPKEIPQLSGWEFAARWQPAREVAGDYFDFIPLENNMLGLLVADVTDKGAPAALFMIFSNSIVRASLRADITPQQSIQNANRLITEKSPNAMFVTLVYVMLDPDSGSATYVNAGHNPPLLYHARTHTLEKLSRTGMVLGIDAETLFTQRTLNMQRGDLLLLYTDGLVDAIDGGNHPFGMERLEQLLLDSSQLSANKILDQLENKLSEHSGGAIPIDDVTLLLVKHL